MKVLLDANIYLSYLLAPDTERTITAVVATCLTLDEIDLLLPSGLVAEIATKATTKQYFHRRIPRAAVEQMIARLAALTALLPPLEEGESFSRDPKDDYLIACAIAYEADYLVTGDGDLLSLGAVGAVAVVTPAKFLSVLRREQLIP